MFVGRFGFWDVVLTVAPSLISAAGSVGAALISREGAKEVAKIQARTQLQAEQAAILAQERIAQLQLEALKSTIPSPEQTKTELTQKTYPIEPVSPQVQQAGVVNTSIGGVPILYLALGGLLIYLLSKKD